MHKKWALNFLHVNIFNFLWHNMFIITIAYSYIIIIYHPSFFKHTQTIVVAILKQILMSQMSVSFLLSQGSDRNTVLFCTQAVLDLKCITYDEHQMYVLVHLVLCFFVTYSFYYYYFVPGIINL